MSLLVIAALWIGVLALGLALWCGYVLLAERAARRRFDAQDRERVGL